MSGALSWHPIQPVDIGGAFARGQQVQANRLATLAQQRQLAQGQQMDEFLAQNAQGLAASDPTKRMNILAQLASMGPQGLALAAPQIEQTRNYMDFMGPGGASASPGAPASNPAPGGTSRAAIPPAELAPIIAEASRASGVPVAVLNAVYQQESQFGQDPRATANGGGIGQIISSTARNPGYGMQPISDADRLNPARAIPWSAQYLAARGRAAGVTDWNDPAQVDRALAAYNGGGDPNYVANVRRHMGQGDGGPRAIPTAAGEPPARTEGGAAPAAPAQRPQAGFTPDGLPIVPGFDMDRVRRAMSLPNNPLAVRYLQQYRETAQLMQRGEPPETWSPATEIINGEKVQGQRSSRGQFRPFREGPQGSENERLGASLRQLAPLVANGQATEDQRIQFRQNLDRYTRETIAADGSRVPGLPIPPEFQPALAALAARDGRPDASAPPAPGGPPGPQTEVAPSGSTSQVRPPQVTPAERTRWATIETESGRVRDAIAGVRETMQRLGTGWGPALSAYFNNPRDARAVDVNTAFSNLITALRGEAFLNTGVLQPHEVRMINDMLLTPQSLRGLGASQEAYNTLLRRIETFVNQGVERQRRVVQGQGYTDPGIPGPGGRGVAEPPPAAVPPPPSGYRVIR